MRKLIPLFGLIFLFACSDDKVEISQEELISQTIENLQGDWIFESIDFRDETLNENVVCDPFENYAELIADYRFDDNTVFMTRHCGTDWGYFVDVYFDEDGRKHLDLLTEVTYQEEFIVVLGFVFLEESETVLVIQSTTKTNFPEIELLKEL